MKAGLVQKVRDMGDDAVMGKCICSVSGPTGGSARGGEDGRRLRYSSRG